MIEPLKIRIGAKPFASLERAQNSVLEKWAMTQTKDELATNLPLMFNLCKSAQNVALCLCNGQEVSKEMVDALCQEIITEHRFRLKYFLPKRFRFDGNHLSPQEIGIEIYEILSRQYPRLLAVRFPAQLMEGMTPKRTYPALRQFTFMDIVQARIADLERFESGARPHFGFGSNGAFVDAARGSYGLNVAYDARDQVTHFQRRTPSDHMAREGGAIEFFLNALPMPTVHELEIGLAILDPCQGYVFRKDPVHA